MEPATPAHRAKLSVILITYNEAHVLDQTLAALRNLADEIVVVDSGSTDGTQRIAQEHGARVLQRPFDGFGTQKQYAVAQASHDWVLALDADEAVTPELANGIAHALQAPTAVGYHIQRTLVFLDHKFKASGEAKRPILRLFHRQFGTYNDSQVHEQVELQGQLETLSGELLHYSYRNLAHYFDKFNAYTTQGALEAQQQQKRVGLLAAMARIPLAFVKVYLIRSGWRDGYAGFVWALFSSMAPFVKYVKLKEAQGGFEPRP